MKKVCFLLLLTLVVSSCFSQSKQELDSLLGLWFIRVPEGGYSTKDFLEITKDGTDYLLSGQYQKSLFNGKIEIVDGTILFKDPIHGDHIISWGRSIDPLWNNSIDLSQINEYGDIWLGSFQNIEVIKKIEEEEEAW